MPFRVLPTPNPNLFTFATTHEQTSLKEWPRQYSTIFKEWPDNISSIKGKVSASGVPYGNFMYTGSAEAPAGYVTFLWAPVLTDEQKSTPFQVHQYNGDQHWPAILQSISFLQDNQFMQATNNGGGGVTLAPSTYTRTVYVPAADQGTLFRVLEYLSPTPFKIPLNPAPQTTDVSYDYLGARGSFPNCLHPDLKFPSLRTATKTYTAGTPGAASGVLRGQRFPATDFEDWSPYFASDKQNQVNGIWHRVRIQVFPPLQPETSIR